MRVHPASLVAIVALAGCGGASTSMPAGAAPASPPASSAADASEPSRAAGTPRPESPEAEASAPQPPAPDESAEALAAAGAAAGAAGKPSRATLIVKYADDPSADALQFEIGVDGQKMSGVFMAPAGQTTTFSLPAGRIGYRQGACNEEEEHVVLAGGESATLACWVSAKQGPCCQLETDRAGSAAGR